MPVPLHVLAPGAAGGLETVVRMLTAGLTRTGMEVHAHLVVDPGADVPLADPLRTAGVGVHVTEVPPRRYGVEREATRSLCRRLGVDVVHCHGYRADVVDAGAARGMGLPVLSTVHGFTGGGLRNALYEWLQLRALRRMDRVVAVSAPLVDRLAGRGIAPERIALLRNAYAPTDPPLPPREARAALGLSGPGPHVGWIGRMSPEKGPDVFVAAALRSERDDARWVLVGDGPARAAVEEAARGAGGRLVTTGLVPEAGRLVRAFDLLVLSSRTEGTPIVALEAMAAGVPVVATSVGGVPELLEGGAGALVPPERPDVLADAVDRLLGEPERAADQARRARERLEDRYALEPWVEAHRALYRELARS